MDDQRRDEQARVARHNLVRTQVQAYLDCWDATDEPALLELAEDALRRAREEE